MPIVSIARVLLNLEKRGFTEKEAAFSDAVWMLAAVIIWGVAMYLL
jgi:hypothetical protein